MRRRARRDGFTLIELVVVMAVLAVVTAVAVPALRFPAETPSSASESVLRVVRDARAHAVRRGERLELVLDARSDAYWLMGSDGVQLDAGRFAFPAGARWGTLDVRLKLGLTTAGGVEGALPPLADEAGALRPLRWNRWNGRPLSEGSTASQEVAR